MDQEFEELEQIPWAALAATPGDSRARNASIAIAIAAIVGLVGWLVVRGGNESTVTIATNAPPATVAPVVDPDETTTAPDATVYSEADLMLIDVEDEERLAIAQAEWLVRDYLTVDEDTVVASRLDAILPGIERGSTPAYVEWARAFAVSYPEPGTYRVEVIYRLLTGDEAGFIRQPAAALVVDVAVDVDGTTQLLAVPEPVPVPFLRGLDG